MDKTYYDVATSSSIALAGIVANFMDDNVLRYGLCGVVILSLGCFGLIKLGESHTKKFDKEIKDLETETFYTFMQRGRTFLN